MYILQRLGSVGPAKAVPAGIQALFDADPQEQTILRRFDPCSTGSALRCAIGQMEYPDWRERG